MHSIRNVRTLLSASALMLALAPSAFAATPTPRPDSTGTPASCIAATHTGVYRVMLRRDRVEPVFALLVVERASGCLSAMLITDGTQSIINGATISGGVLSGELLTESGKAKVSVRVDGDAVTGTVDQGKKVWAVTGERTS